MRHRKQGRKLSLKSGARKKMLRNLAASIILYERVETTEARAKEVRRLVEQLITVGKKRTLAAKRQLLAELPQKLAAAKIQKELVTKYEKRNGGYTRIVRLNPRAGDNSPRVVIELI